MRQFRTSGSVGAPGSDPRGHPTFALRRAAQAYPPIPGPALKLVQEGAGRAAFGVAVTANPRASMRARRLDKVRGMSRRSRYPSPRSRYGVSLWSIEKAATRILWAMAMTARPWPRLALRR